MSSSATSTFPGLKLEFAPGIGAKSVPAPGDWVDITSRLRRFSIDRGTSGPSVVLTDGFSTGTMRVDVTNSDRALDPDYASSPYAGDLVPNVQIRLTATFGATTKVLFLGFIESWPQSWPGQDSDAVVSLVASDAFATFANTKLPGSVYELTIRTDGPIAWWQLGESSGTVAGDASGGGHHGTYNSAVIGNETALVPYSGPKDGSKLFDGIDDFVTVSGVPFDTSDNTQSVEFWMKTTQVPTGGGALLFKAYAPTTTFDGFVIKMLSNGVLATNAFVVSLGIRSSIAVNDGKSHHVVVSRSAYADTIYVDGVNVTVDVGSMGAFWNTTGTFIGGEPLATAGGAATEPFQGLLDEVTAWDGALSSSDVTAHYEAGTAPWDGQTSGERVGAVLDAIGWDASLRDLDDGDSILGPAVLGTTALEHLRLVESTEMGLLFVTADGNVRLVGRGNLLSEATYRTSQATFGDQAGEMKYHDVSLEPGHIFDVVNTARCSRQGGIEQTYTDDTSADLYGDRDKSLSGLLMPTDAEAYDRAYAEVLLRKDPRSRISSLVVRPGRDGTNLYPKVLGYDLGTRLTVKRRPGGTTAITKEARIAGIRHQGTASALDWETTWSTAGIDPNESLWLIVDSATQGIVDTNLVAY